MSVLHVNQIKNYLESEYFTNIDLTLEEAASSSADNIRYTRSLAALGVNLLTEAGIKESCETIVDGGDDNGIDSIYYDSDERCLYFLQSKFHHDGNGSIELGDTLKFIQGVKDIINARFDRFNQKVQDRKETIMKHLLDAQTKFFIVLTHTGVQSLSTHCQTAIDQFLEEYNDISDIFNFRVLDQKRLHDYISFGASGAPFNVDVVLHAWSDVKEPFQAFFGQIAASDLADWYDKHGRLLFSPNIRVYLGETDVNEGIAETLREAPERFWYFNNGITVLCDSIVKKPIGGSGHETGIFECQNLRIVNGAQTVGSISRSAKSLPQNLENAKVWVRLISLSDAPAELAKTITMTNNTQNRIEKRDFVSLDPEQKRIYEELSLEGIVYLYKSGETRDPDEEGFDLTEATVARACLQDDIQMSVQAKREIGKLWDDIEKAPYKILFNNGVQGPQLWRLVQIARLVEKFVATKKKRSTGRDKLMITHSNRFLLHLVFGKIEKDQLNPDSMLREDDIDQLILRCFETLNEKVNELYPESVLGSLFKNLTKCRDIKNNLLHQPPETLIFDNNQ